MDQNHLQIVAEDLEYLRDGWNPNIGDPDIRRGSATLRRLLIEGEYANAWRAVGNKHEPKLIATDLESSLEGIPRNKIYVAVAMGANFRGVYLANAAMIENSAPEQPVLPPPLRPDGYPGEKEFSISRYLNSAAIICGDTTITRADIIKYVANVKGGVHLGKGAKKSELELIEKVSQAEQKLVVHMTDGILVEIVSIAQAIGSSNDASMYISKIRGQQ